MTIKIGPGDTVHSRYAYPSLNNIRKKNINEVFSLSLSLTARFSDPLFKLNESKNYLFNSITH